MVKIFPYRIFPVTLFTCVFMLFFTIYAARAIEIPPEVEKKTVTLTKSNADAEVLFINICGKCHKVPDPAKPEPAKSACTAASSKEDLARIEDYRSNVHAGKSLYESYCSRCHALIKPESHTLDYWSKNLCTSDSCMVKKKLSKSEEQQVLLYLSSHSDKNQGILKRGQ